MPTHDKPTSHDKPTTGAAGVIHGAGAAPDINKQVARSVYDAFNEKQYDRAVALAADNIECTTMAFGAKEKGKDGFKRWLSNWGTAMPDCKVELKHQYATENGVVSEFHVTGTHKGPLTTPQSVLAPTGHKLALDVVDVMDMKDGKIIKLRSYFDGLAMMKMAGGIK